MHGLKALFSSAQQDANVMSDETASALQAKTTPAFL